VNKLVVASFRHNHDISDGAPDWPTLKLLRDLANTCRSLDEARMRHVLIIFYFLEYLVYVDGSIKSLVIEAR
jgi:hypothetical protein